VNRCTMPAIDRRLPVAVALISSASFGYELLLFRFFSIMYWGHFAHLIISMALLGFGVSGTVLTLAQQRLLPSFPRAFSLHALLFALALLAATSLANRLGFNPPEVIWHSGQLGRLTTVIAVAIGPFFCAGLCIGLALRWKSAATARLYRADLIGAASGALLIMALLFVLRPHDGVRILALIGVVAAVLVGGFRSSGLDRIVLTVVVLLIGLWPARWLAPVMSPYKSMAQTLLVPGVRLAAETHSPFGQFSALTSDKVPFRYAPGLSLLAPAAPPSQVALFHDGHAAGVILHAPAGAVSLEFLRWTPMALPYALLKQPRVLIAGAGGGGDVWQALQEKAARVDAVEPHREFIELVGRSFGAFSGGIFAREKVHVFYGDVRGHLAASGPPYDLIQISPLGTVAPPAAGGHALEARYLYTVEGVRLALSRLSPDGLLAVTLPLELPPRSAVKMTATMAAALKQLDANVDPSRHVMIIRSWNTVTLVVSPAPLSAQRLAVVRSFCRCRAFDIDWLPDIGPEEVNRINVLDRPYLYHAVLDIWRDGSASRLPVFNLVPATDDRPWFSHFFRWSSFGQLWEQRAFGTASMVEWEYLLLWISLAVALAISLLAIIWPLRPLRHARIGHTGGSVTPLFRALYFAALGLAFFFLEIAFMQQFIRFLSHPVLAMAIVVPSFLVFAGCGSGLAQPFADRVAACRWTWIRDRPSMVAIVILVAVALAYRWLLPLFFHIGASWPDMLRLLATMLLIGGLAWMGMPFPLGLTRLGRHHPDFIPVAWGVNGFFSVISAIAATILALYAGFQVVVVAALAFYFLATVCEQHL